MCVASEQERQNFLASWNYLLVKGDNKQNFKYIYIIGVLWRKIKQSWNVNEVLRVPFAEKENI